MFSDQSTSVPDFHDGRQRVWRRTREHYQLQAMIAHDRYAGGSVMVWGGITMTGRTELHICRGNVTGLYYRDNVIEPIVAPYARLDGNALIFSRRQWKSPLCMCCPRSPAVSHNHDSSMASKVPRPVSTRTFVEHPRETCPETSSQATGHRQAR